MLLAHGYKSFKSTAHGSKLTHLSLCSANNITQNLLQRSAQFSSAATVKLSAF